METQKFKMYEKYGKKRNAQSFDLENIFTIKAGKKYNNYEAIQAAREDTEIYPTLEKYGSIEAASSVMNRTKDQLEGYGADLRGVTNLRDVFEMQRAAEIMWQNLPLDIRREFNHSQEDFIKNGQKWINDRIKQIDTERKEAAAKENAAATTTEGVTNNE